MIKFFIIQQMYSYMHYVHAKNLVKSHQDHNQDKNPSKLENFVCRPTRLHKARTWHMSCQPSLQLSTMLTKQKFVVNHTVRQTYDSRIKRQLGNKHTFCKNGVSRKKTSL
jgi:hypothetical protein